MRGAAIVGLAGLIAPILACPSVPPEGSTGAGPAQVVPSDEPAAGADEIPADLCGWMRSESYRGRIKQDIQTASHLSAWLFYRLTHGYSGGATIDQAMAEARENGWAIPPQAFGDDIEFSRAVRRVTGQSSIVMASCTGPDDEALAPIEIDRCTSTPEVQTDKTTGRSVRTWWFDCTRARASVSIVAGPSDFVDVMVRQFVPSQKALAVQRGGLEVAAEDPATVMVDGVERSATRVLYRSPTDPKAMLAYSERVDDRAYTFVCVTALDVEDARCPSAFSQMSAFARSQVGP